VDGLLAEAKARNIQGLRALVCPHAGYRYSGPIAASGFKQLAGQKFERVVVMAPSHHVRFNGVAIPDVDALRTPIGKIPMSAVARQLATARPFIIDSAPHAKEHALEVELPFLQRVLSHFELVPLVFGEVDEARVAQRLNALVDADTFFVASSDLSHYFPYEKAKELDKVTVDAILKLDVEAMASQGQACGKSPVLALMHLARLRGWKTALLDYRNSGDTAGDRSRVVGYSAIAFFDDPSARPVSQQVAISKDDRRTLLRLARTALVRAVKEGRLADTPGGLPSRLVAKKGSFVTLTVKGELRGCIGNIFPEMPLVDAIIHNARSAALSDPRFSPVTADELPSIEIEVSILSVPEPLKFSSPADLLQKLKPHQDGVVMNIGPRRSTFLPQVWEQLPDANDFLSHLAAKAGLPRDAWRGPNTEIMIYHVDAFKESELSHD
jgi:AmmeMemoRadiSam system protein B/AmmeMemoRadiSam system protein A